MNKNRISGLFLGVIVIVIMVAITQVTRMALGANEAGRSPVGAGDLRQAEGQQVILPNTGSETVGSYAGSGELRRFEAQQKAVDEGALESRTYKGRGDVLRYEVKKSKNMTISLEPASIGIGDFRRFEAGQVSRAAGK